MMNFSLDLSSQTVLLSILKNANPPLKFKKVFSVFSYVIAKIRFLFLKKFIKYSKVTSFCIVYETETSCFLPSQWLLCRHSK